MFSGLFDLTGWQHVGVALILTHITIASVTIFLHRHQAHRALELHPVVSHFFRFWLWLTTGMVTREWTAIHRKHHAKVETADDPHSPQVVGIHKVLWGGVFLYVKESRNPDTLARYGHGTPDDWIERHLYSPLTKYGILLMLSLDLLLFGLVPGVLIWGAQALWIPFWAAGVINGLGHFWGYRNYQSEDAATNLFPWGILIGGEELHNNHHAYATSARLSSKWYEFDIGWFYIRVLECLGLATVKKLAPQVKFDAAKAHCDLDTLHAVITHRYDVLTAYAKSLTGTCRAELTRLKARAGAKRAVTRGLRTHPEHLKAPERAALEIALQQSRVLHTVYAMRDELAQIWARSTASKEQLVQQLEDWCRRAETSGITALQDFSGHLRRYA